jgi:phosphoglycerol transferase MdoB-like AlkP superfamily enzyme
LQPQRRSEVVSQIDVLPTVAGMLQQPYVNTTLGRDLLNPAKQNNYAFIIYHDEGRIGILTDTYYFTKNINFVEEHLYPVAGEELPYTLAQQDSIKRKLTNVTTAIYETGKWMLMNNKESN